MTVLSPPDMWRAVPSGDVPLARIDAWPALDSRAHPTTACRVTLADGSSGRALVPTGASVGRFEVADLRDGGTRYAGLGVGQAVAAIIELGRRHAGSPIADVERSLTGPSNVTLAISTAAAKAAASSSGIELWRLFDVDRAASLPCPMVNIFSGGRHAEGGVRVQDFLALPTGASSYGEALHSIWRVRRAAAELVAERYGTLMSRLVADEGGLAVLAGDDEEPLALLAAAIESVGDPVGIAIDVAATQLDDPEAFEDTIVDWCARYPIVSVEDPFGDDDWTAWKRIGGRLDGLQLVGDDLFATDHRRVERAAEMGVANTVLVKPNQIGSLSGAWRTIETARTHGYRTVISARSGDTEDDVLADLAVGWNGGQIKIGSLMRSERLAKYNRLAEIEATADLPYAGWSSL